jgi:hypothetical protein
MSRRRSPASLFASFPFLVSDKGGEDNYLYLLVVFQFHLVCNGLKLYLCWSDEQEFHLCWLVKLLWRFEP